MDALDPRHGTTAGYTAHHKIGDTPCAECKEAKRLRDRELKDARNHPCAECGQPCRHESTVCRPCNSKNAAHWAAIARDAKRGKNTARRPVVERVYSDHELRYDGGWVRRGLVLMPTVKRPEEAA